jgi:hypothetical protein
MSSEKRAHVLREQIVNRRLYFEWHKRRLRHRCHGDIPHAKFEPSDNLFTDVENTFIELLVIDT